MAAVAAINGLAGLALVAWPGLARAADFDPSRHRLPALGLLQLAGGLLLGTAQLWRRAPARFVRAAHLAAAAGFLAFGAGVSLPQRAWTALAVNSAYALVLALAPWLSRRLDRRSPPSLRARLALVLAVATSLALVATAALATWQEERLALEQMRAAQEVEAQAIAANLAEFLRLTGEGRPWAVVPRIGRAGARVEVWNRDGERIGGGHADGRGLDLPPLPAGWQRAVLAGLRPEVGARLVGFARVPGRDWLVTVERSPGAELGRVRRGRDLALLLLLLVLPLAVLGGVLLARRITRPLSALSAAVSAMAAGQPAVPVAASDIGEVARLSGAFSELRARLAERTRESERLAAELRSRAEALSESDRRKDEFLAMLAHELRNPLSAIANAAHLLHELVPEEERLQKAAAIVRRQVGHLVRLVDDLLDVSRITRGKVALRREALDLRDSVRQAVDTARPLFEAKRQFLRLELPPAPLPLWADPTRLEQVIGNLLRNAAKYTDPGGHVEIAAALDGDQAVLRVRDDGQGIAPELLPQIFDLFVQGGETQERAGAGLGIGLTLVRRLVTLHGGSVEASSDGPGAGAEFVVRLPAAETAPATPAQTGAPAASGRGLP
jgi:signal transduction histidine kinase